ncbi:MAG: hypothetical protein RLZZ519_2408 [Bacteroidota bacterium]
MLDVYLNMLDLEFAYFLENQDKWSSEHYGKYVVVVGQTVFGFFDTDEIAYRAALKELQLGTFLIQHCIPGPESYTQTFVTNVILS